LASLDANRELAGDRYERIRRKMLVLFERRGCEHADRLADEVMDRAARKIHGGAAVPAVERYCYGIARVMVLEARAALRRRQHAFEHFNFSRTAPTDTEEVEAHLCRLECALQTLSESERELILAYYEGEGGDRISYRRALAERYGIPGNALRIRAHRVRVKLQSHFFPLSAAT
jgi:DNA-directed RNA polymerase specialized sigma24 family protein